MECSCGSEGRRAIAECCQALMCRHGNCSPKLQGENQSHRSCFSSTTPASHTRQGDVGGSHLLLGGPQGSRGWRWNACGVLLWHSLPLKELLLDKDPVVLVVCVVEPACEQGKWEALNVYPCTQHIIQPSPLKGSDTPAITKRAASAEWSK